MCSICFQEMNELGGYIDCFSHFIKILIIALNKKLSFVFDKSKTNHSLLCHLIDEIVSANQIICNEFGYAGGGNVNINMMMIKNQNLNKHNNILNKNKDEDEKNKKNKIIWPTLTYIFENDELKFAKWIDVDLEYSRRRLNTIMTAKHALDTLKDTLNMMPSMNNANQNQTSSVSINQHNIKMEQKKQVRNMTITESCDNVIQLLRNLFQRSICFSELKNRLLFIQKVQIILINDYHIILNTFIDKSFNNDTIYNTKPLPNQKNMKQWRNYCNILNSYWTFINVLIDFSQNNQYIQLYEYQLISNRNTNRKRLMNVPKRKIQSVMKSIHENKTVSFFLSFFLLNSILILLKYSY